MNYINTITCMNTTNEFYYRLDESIFLQQISDSHPTTKQQNKAAKKHSSTTAELQPNNYAQ